jgi:hypothetical protein
MLQFFLKNTGAMYNGRGNLYEQVQLVLFHYANSSFPWGFNSHSDNLCNNNEFESSHEINQANHLVPAESTII